MARLIVATRHTPPDVDDVAIRERAALAEAWPKVDAWAGEIGVRTSDDVAHAIAAVEDRYAHPPKASLTQGDPAPSNVVFTPEGQARLIDFEYGAQRHVLADLAQWWIRCPLPEPWFEAIVDEVRAALIAAQIYRDADEFDDDLAHIASIRCALHVHMAADRTALGDDPAWVGAWRVRQALLSSSSRGMRAARAGSGLAPLADWLAELNSAMTRLAGKAATARRIGLRSSAKAADRFRDGSVQAGIQTSQFGAPLVLQLRLLELRLAREIRLEQRLDFHDSRQRIFVGNLSVRR